MNFSARRNTLEARRKSLAGIVPVSRPPKVPERRCGERLESFKVDELRQVDVALARLDEGSYGFCQICGDDISDDRLDRHPATPFCQCCGD